MFDTLSDDAKTLEKTDDVDEKDINACILNWSSLIYDAIENTKKNQLEEPPFQEMQDAILPTLECLKDPQLKTSLDKLVTAFSPSKLNALLAFIKNHLLPGTFILITFICMLLAIFL